MSLLVRHEIQDRRQTHRERRRSRRELREQDRRSARLAQLHEASKVLVGALGMVDHGWIQNGWFRYVDDEGVRRTVVGWSPRLARALGHDTVVGACLVGAIVHAAGGPEHARSSSAQRAIDLTWHASFRGEEEPFRWLPSPTERAGHVIDLVHWNDLPERRPDDVAAVLHRAQGLAAAEGDRMRVSPEQPQSSRW
jgi:hypothetical protein